MAIDNQQMMNGVQQPEQSLPMGEEQDRPMPIGEMDFQFLTENDPAVEPQNAAINMKKNLTPEEQKEIAGLVPYVERFFVLNYKAETGEYPPEPTMEPEGGGGITIDEYRSMSDEERLASSTEGQEVSLNLKSKSSFDRSPSQLPQALPVGAPEMEQAEAPEMEQPVQQPMEQPAMQANIGGKIPPAKVQTNKAAPKDKEAVPAGPVGEINVEGKDKSGVADDIQTKSDGFVLSKGAVIANGKMYIRDVIQDAIDNLNKKGVRVDIDKIPEKAEDILISNGEIVIPDIIAQEIGYKRLEKMNNRGKELTEKLVAEHEQQQGQQQQAQLVPGFQDGGDAALTEEQIKNRDYILKDLGERRDTEEQASAMNMENQMKHALPETKIEKPKIDNVETARIDTTPETISVEPVPFSKVDFELFKIGYKGHNPTVKTIRDVKWEANVLNQFDTIKPTAQITNAINSVLPAFKELERHNLYNRDFFEKLAIVESNSGDPKQMISDTDDYGVFQINIDAIGKTFNDESSFNNSFKKYYSDRAAQVTGYSADKLKELYNADIEKFKDLLIKDPKLNLALAIAGSIMPNLDSQANMKMAKKND
tara:strand:+ start:42 stop:1820 length:1779 start_codon:yes stop_codon:yes gene_type:complete